MPVPSPNDGSRLLAVLLAVTLAIPAFATTAAAQSGSASVTFDDQTAGGTTVVVSSVEMPNGGFVAIHDATLADGEVLKSVVGASGFLSAGSHEDVRVQLSEPLTADATLIAMPHKDTDGDQIYSFVADNGKTDGPYTKDGGAVTDDAEVTISATVNAEDQPTDGQSIMVDRVEMAKGGFVAIHDDRLLEGMPLASVVGVSDHLSSGVHENVRVSLTKTVTENETLIPMPHKDTDDDETYDFQTSGGSEDGPYTNASGKAVIDTAKVSPSSTSTVTFEQQTTGGTNLYVASTFLPEGGFVTIHDSSLAEGEVLESVRGVSECLEPGIHRHIKIQLDDPLTDDDMLIAMPHKDTNDNCEYDFVDSEGQEDGPYTKDGSAVTDNGDVTYSASVHQHGQESDGNTVTVASVDLSNGGFVAIHTPALLAGEVTGSVVGTSSYLEAGAYEDVKVKLDDPIRTSQTLIPMPHKDTDGDKTYDFVTSGGQDDGPYANADGSAVVDTGFTTVRSQVTITDQKSEGTVTVDSVTLHNGGFVTIHDDSLLDGKPLASVLGTSAKLGPGTHEDVEVSLDEVPEGDATVIAMPHKDTNDNGAYDFVTSEGADDGPYVAGGGAVVDTASATFPTSTDDTDDGTTDGTDGTTDDGASGGGDEGQQAPGPGALLTALALVGVGLLVARRRER